MTGNTSEAAMFRPSLLHRAGLLASISRRTVAQLPLGERPASTRCFPASQPGVSGSIL